MSIKTHPEKIISDNPIEEFEHDLFDRKKSVEKFVQHVLNVDCSKGLVVGIFAPWGEGKTSYLNLAKSEFQEADIHVFDFNPWMYGDANQLVYRFFREIAGKMKLTTGMEKVGDHWERFGDAAMAIASGVSTLFGTPINGAVLSTLGQPIRKIFSPKSTIQLRESVANSLSERDSPIIVVLDDVDRLSTPEIKDIFKLVRLTANFPNLIYILLFDHQRVEKALQDEGNTGREYLDKIIQIPYNLPKVPRDVIRSHLKKEIAEAIQKLGGKEPDSRIMIDIYPEIIFPLIHNMRDVRRYVAAVNETLSTLSDRVAVADLLALEAIRLFLPKFFEVVPDLINDITYASASRSNEKTFLQQFDEINSKQSREERIKNRIKELYKSSGKNDQVIQSLIYRLFHQPLYDSDANENSDIGIQLLGRLLHERRVAHQEVLCCYLERVDNAEILGFNLAKHAIELLNNSKQFDEFLLSLPQDRRSDAVSQLIHFIDLCQPGREVPGIIGLLNILPKLVFESEFESDDVQFFINLFIKKLLDKHVADKQCENLSATFEILLCENFVSINTISSKFTLLKKIESEYFEQNGKHLNPCSQYWEILYQEIHDAPNDVLAKECKLMFLYEFAKQKNDSLDYSENLVIDNSPEITFAILYSARTEGAQTSLDSRYEHIETGFAVERLIELFGDSEELKKRVGTMEENFENVSTEFESLGCKPAIVNSILDDARRMVSETSE